MKRIQLRVGADQAGQRLDKFLAAHSGLTRGECRRAIEEGGVWIDGHRIRRLSLPVQVNRLVEIAVEDAPARAGAPSEPRLLFEDRAILVVDKPPGLPTEGTLTSDRRSLLGWAQRLRGREVRTVHRLDVGTSGVMILAKSASAAASLAEQFRLHSVQKRYRAICLGALPSAAGRIDSRIRPSPRRGVFEPCARGGVPAITDYRVLESRPPFLLVEASPVTGRTHQVRVHLAGAGAPLLGDKTYGGQTSVAIGAWVARANRPLLHAQSIAFAHPEYPDRVEFQADPPSDFEAIVAHLAALPAGAGPA